MGIRGCQVESAIAKVRQAWTWTSAGVQLLGSLGVTHLCRVPECPDQIPKRRKDDPDFGPKGATQLAFFFLPNPKLSKLPNAFGLPASRAAGNDRPSIMTDHGHLCLTASVFTSGVGGGQVCRR
jgi:hypothetical protein